jgi:murein tripeptide amidase MpaA
LSKKLLGALAALVLLAGAHQPPPAAVRKPAAAAAPKAQPAPAAKAQPPGACDRFVKALPNVNRALCESAGLVDSGARSVQGTPLYLRDIGEPHARLRVLVIGAIHGDELSSSSLALHWLRLAATETMQMPQPVQWRFVPVLNPDGMLAHPPRRPNAHGVDLNRNFPTPTWEHDAAVYGQ